MQLVDLSLQLWLLMSDPWVKFGPPLQPQPPVIDVVVTGRMSRIAQAPVNCSIYFTAVVAEYVDLKVVEGEPIRTKRVAVAHPCAEMARQTFSRSAGTLEAFRVGDSHRLELAHENPWPLLDFVFALDDPASAPDYYAVRVDSVASGDEN